MGAIVFAASFVPQIDSLKSIFYFNVEDCNWVNHLDSVHGHWSNQHYIWTWTGVVLLITQIAYIIYRLDRGDFK